MIQRRVEVPDRNIAKAKDRLRAREYQESKSPENRVAVMLSDLFSVGRGWPPSRRCNQAAEVRNEVFERLPRRHLRAGRESIRGPSERGGLPRQQSQIAGQSRGAPRRSTLWSKLKIARGTTDGGPGQVPVAPRSKIYSARSRLNPRVPNTRKETHSRRTSKINVTCEAPLHPRLRQIRKWLRAATALKTRRDPRPDTRFAPCRIEQPPRPAATGDLERLPRH